MELARMLRQLVQPSSLSKLKLCNLISAQLIKGRLKFNGSVATTTIAYEQMIVYLPPIQISHLIIYKERSSVLKNPQSHMSNLIMNLTCGEWLAI